MNIESDANKDLALESEDAESVVGGTRKKKVAVKHHVATTGGKMIVEDARGALGNEGVLAPVPVDPGY